MRSMCVIPIVITPRLSVGLSCACLATARTTALTSSATEVSWPTRPRHEGNEFVGDDFVSLGPREGGERPVIEQGLGVREGDEPLVA